MEKIIYKEKIKSIPKNALYESIFEKKNLLQQFLIEMTKEIPEDLPIDIFLDISPENLSSLFSFAKYAIKYDDKGWSNNSSALINILNNGCILYAGWGMCTSQEVTNGLFKEAIVLTKGKYCLRRRRKTQFLCRSIN